MDDLEVLARTFYAAHRRWITGMAESADIKDPTTGGPLRSDSYISMLRKGFTKMAANAELETHTEGLFVFTRLEPNGVHVDMRVRVGHHFGPLFT